MAATDGHIELERTVSSIQIGARHRHDLGDLDTLAASIQRYGLLQPITITPDGVLVCGARSRGDQAARVGHRPSLGTLRHLGPARTSAGRAGRQRPA